MNNTINNSINETTSSPLPGNSKPERPGFHWSSFWVVAVVGVSLLFFVGGSVAMMFVGVVSLFPPDSNIYDAATSFSYFAASGLIALLLLPAGGLGILRLSGKQTLENKWLAGRLEKLPLWGLFLFYALAVAAGSLLLYFDVLVWLAVPLLNMFSLALPVLIFIKLGGEKLNGGSLQRTWSVFAVSMTLTLLLTIMVELVAILLVLILVGVVGQAFFPLEIEALMDIFLQLQVAGVNDVDQITNTLFGNPFFIGAVLSVVAVIVPIIEEILKPTALWLTARRPLTLQEGWVTGLLAGAGFALVENLGNVSISAEWGYLVIARFGATALHMFNTGLIGYTYALARKEKRYVRLVPAFLLVMVIHGVWNGTVILANINAPENLETIWPVGLIIILALLATCLSAGIVWMNRKLRRKQEISITESEIV